jgi:hypothetical protein
MLVVAAEDITWSNNWFGAVFGQRTYKSGRFAHFFDLRINIPRFDGGIFAGPIIQR